MQRPDLVTQIDWWRVLPWLEIFKVPGVAARFRLICLGTLLYSTSLGFFGYFPSPAEWRLHLPGFKDSAGGNPAAQGDDGPNGRSAKKPALTSGEATETPPILLPQPRPGGITRWAFNFLGMALMIMVYAVMTRLAAFELAREERLELLSGLRYVGKRLFSVLGCLFLLAIALLVSMVYQLVLQSLLKSPVGEALVWLLLPVTLVVYLAAIFFSVALLVGIPFMVSAVAINGSDAFDALGRGCTYATRQPFRLLGYFLLAFPVYLAAWVVTSTVEGIAIAWMRLPSAADVAEVTSGMQRHTWFWTTLLKYLIHGYEASVFVTLLTSLYLLRRRDLDDALLDDIHRDEETKHYELSPLPASPRTDAPADAARESAPSAGP